MTDSAADASPEERAEITVELDRQREPHVTMTRGLEAMLLAHLARFATEQGAVLMGHRDEHQVEVVAAVVPVQNETSGISCSFDVTVIDLIHQAIEALGEPCRSQIGSVLGWAHSHPRLGVFLSDQDVVTLASWTNLDPAAIAMVLDPHSYRRQIGVWGRHNTSRQLILAQEEVARSFTLRSGLPFATEVGARPVTNGLPLWDLVCSDGVLTVRPPLAPPSPERRR